MARKVSPHAAQAYITSEATTLLLLGSFLQVHVSLAQ